MPYGESLWGWEPQLPLGFYERPTSWLEEVSWPRTPFSLLDHAAIVARRGSEAHGLYVPPEEDTGTDDRDLIGVVIPPIQYYLGLESWEGVEEIRPPWDVVLYEFKKVVRLLCKQNPNILSLLWLAPADYLYVSQGGQALLAARKLFRAKQPAYAAFIGYADSKLSHLEQFETKGYMGEKRKKLIERFGYDTRNASHLIRLLHMGAEYLETGELQVKRTVDRDLLLRIKRGEWLLPDIRAYAAEVKARCNRALESSPLPETVDLDKIDRLVVLILADVLGDEWEGTRTTSVAFA